MWTRTPVGGAYRGHVSNGLFFPHNNFQTSPVNLQTGKCTHGDQITQFSFRLNSRTNGSFLSFFPIFPKRLKEWRNSVALGVSCRFVPADTLCESEHQFSTAVLHTLISALCSCDMQTCTYWKARENCFSSSGWKRGVTA